MNQFKITKKCISSNAYECWNSDGEYYNGTEPSSTQRAFIDSSGRSWVNWNGLFLDTNGFKKPNQFGKDRFVFRLCARTSSPFLSSDCDSTTKNIRGKLVVYPDNLTWGPCEAPNRCNTEKNYFGTSWLYK